MMCTDTPSFRGHSKTESGRNLIRLSEANVPSPCNCFRPSPLVRVRLAKGGKTNRPDSIEHDAFAFIIVCIIRRTPPLPRYESKNDVQRKMNFNRRYYVHSLALLGRASHGCELSTPTPGSFSAPSPPARQQGGLSVRG